MPLNRRSRRSRIRRSRSRRSRAQRAGYEQMQMPFPMRPINQQPPAPPMLVREISMDDWRDALHDLQQSNQDIKFFKQSGNWRYAVARVGNQYRCKIYMNNQLVSDNNCTHLLH
jgi:hypothetical protein